MLLSILATIKAITLFIIKALAVGGVIFIMISLIATQIMDIYEARTGESWEARCKRLHKEREAEEGKSDAE